MDIHPPHHPIRSVRDFMLQIFTVTCGIIIALGLEALVNWRADENLARVTRDDFRAEITGNLASLSRLRPEAERDYNWMRSLIAYGEARLKHQTAKPPAPLDSRDFLTMQNAAWQTALATQAIHRLGFQEARQLAETYSKQTALKELTDQAEQQWITMASYGDVDGLSDQEARTALGALRISAAYTGSMRGAEDRVIASYKAALAIMRP